MLSHNAVCHFMVVASELFWKIGGMRSQYDGAQDWDLALRASEHVNARQIRHIPQILYHWREIPGSTALRSDAKPYVRAAQIKAVSEHILRKDTEEVAIETLPYTSMLSPRFQSSEQISAVTVVVLEDKVSAPDALKHLLSVVASGGCRTVEILVMGDSRNEGIHQQGSTCVVEGVEIKVEYIQRQPNQSVAEAFNAAAEIVSGGVLCFIQAPLVSASSGWLRELTSNVMRSSVAVAGPKILTDDKKISSAGILLAEHMALPALRGVPWSYMGDFYRGALARDVSALSEECLVVKRQAFLAVGGFDAQRASLPGFEVALSADLRESGFRTICVPKVAIVVPASWQRLRSSKEKERVTQSPCAADSPCATQCDPFWSPHIGPKGELRGS
jgi:GT2 family glycosyltransferase